MSAADYVAIRTRSDGVRVVPRRVAMGLIARGAARIEPRHKADRTPDVPAKSAPVKAKHAKTAPKAEPVEIKVPKVAAAKAPVRPSAPTSDGGKGLPEITQTRGPVERPNHPKSKPEAPKPVVVADDVTPSADVVDVPVVDEPGEDVTALPVEAPAPDVPEPKKNASRKVWAEYAKSRGVTVTSDMTRNQLRDIVAELDTAHLSQPAFAEHSVTGGRLATPEDEPVTEDTVTHGERQDP